MSRFGTWYQLEKVSIHASLVVAESLIDTVLERDHVTFVKAWEWLFFVGPQVTDVTLYLGNLRASKTVDIPFVISPTRVSCRRSCFQKSEIVVVPSTMLPGRHPARRADTAGTGPLVPAATRAAVAEFVATAIFAFAAEGSVYSLCTRTLHARAHACLLHATNIRVTSRFLFCREGCTRTRGRRAALLRWQ
jgi:hypothetical protein